MGRVIAIYNQKGGVGKTSGTAAIGDILAGRGHNILLVDMDAQANLSNRYLEFEPEDTSCDAILGGEIRPQQIRLFLDIVPSCNDLAAFDYELDPADKRFAKALDGVRHQYDVILLDLGPSLNRINISALAACDYLLVPVLPERDSIDGIALVESACERAGKEGGVDGIYLNMYNERRNLDKTVNEFLRETYGDKVFQTHIHQLNALREAGVMRRPITQYAPKSKVAEDYRNLVSELTMHLGI